MSEALLLLRIEHHQMADILGIVEEQLSLDTEMDLGLIRNIVEYFREYPDQCHHPVEDLIYRYIEKRRPELSENLAPILRDHKGISESTAKLGSVLDSVTAGGNGGGKEFRTLMKKFVDSYRSHMEAEERDFFPTALTELQDDDWAEIEYIVFDSRDPLYNKEAEDRFRSLRQEIDKRAATSFRRGAFLRDTKALSQLTSVEAFNDLMSKIQPEYRLVEHPEGTFGLEHNGRTVIDIPKCEPTRAAWCAYFHVAALSGPQSQDQS